MCANETFARCLGPSLPRSNPRVSAQHPSPEHFESLVREHQTAVFRTLTRLTGAGPHVEDLAQEAFLRLYRALPEFRGNAAISTYLYRICFNLAQDAWKSRRREREHRAEAPSAFVREEDEGEWLENVASNSDGKAEIPQSTGAHRRSPEQLLQEKQTEALVDAALLALPAAERTVLVLYHQEDCSYEGIAATLRIPINTVRTHLHRGRKHLAEAVKARMASQHAVRQGPSQHYA